MKGLFFDKKLSFRDDIPKPVPNIDEALIKISLAGICNTDIEITKGYMNFTGILGHEFIGFVEEANDPSYIGQRVTGEINCPCYTCEYCQNGLMHHCPNRSVIGIVKRDGAFAEYITLPIKNLYILPEDISDEEAVFVEPLAAGFQILEQLHIRPDHNVAILGDGKLGLLIAMIFRLSCCELTVFGKHKSKLSLLEDMGINTIFVDDMSKDFSFDVVIEATGSESGLRQAMTITKPRGTIVMKTTIAEDVAVKLSSIVINEITVIGSRCGPFKTAISALQKKFINVSSLITSTFPLEKGIEAFKKSIDKRSIKVLLKI